MNKEDPPYIGNIKDYTFGKEGKWRELRDFLKAFTLILVLETPLYYVLHFISRMILPTFFERLVFYLSRIVLFLELGVVGILVLIILGSFAYFIVLQLCDVFVEVFTLIANESISVLNALVMFLNRTNQQKSKAAK